jgi:hypothetical protein
VITFDSDASVIGFAVHPFGFLTVLPSLMVTVTVKSLAFSWSPTCRSIDFTVAEIETGVAGATG